VVLAFAVTATGITLNTFITPSLPEIMRGVGAEPDQAGLVLAATTLPGVVLAPVAGMLADRFGRRAVLVPSLTVFGVAGGLAATSPSLAWLLGWRFLQGAGSAGLINLAVVLIGDHVSGDRRAGMIGRNAAVLTVGLAVFPLLGGLATDVGGWRAAFLVYPVALLTAAAVGLGLPREPSSDLDLVQQVRNLGPAVRVPGLARALGAAVVSFALIFGVLLTVLPVHLEEAFGVSPTLRGLFFGAAALANAALALSAGRLQRFSKRALLTTAAALFAVALAVIAAGASLPVVVAGMVVFGAGEGLMIPNLQDIAAGSSDTHRGALVALLVSAARAGQTVGPLTASAVFAAVGASATFAVSAGLCLLVLLPLVALGGTRSAPSGQPT
jgi:MFS family permease